MNRSALILCIVTLVSACTSPENNLHTQQSLRVSEDALAGVYSLHEFLWFELTLNCDGTFAWREGGCEVGIEDTASGVWSIQNGMLLLETLVQDPGTESLFEKAEIIEWDGEFAIVIPRLRGYFEEFGPEVGALQRVAM